MRTDTRAMDQDIQSILYSSFEAVPSPTESDDSGLGLSPRSNERKFNLESPSHTLDIFPLSYCGVDITEGPFNEAQYNNLSLSLDPNQSDFNGASLVDLENLLGLADTEKKDKPLQEGNVKNQRKLVDKVTKKRSSSRNPALQSWRLDHCLLPKTGNGKPRQTSTKRKMNNKKKEGKVYPGVRPTTVKERLAELRQQNKSGVAVKQPTAFPQMQTFEQPCVPRVACNQPTAPPMASPTSPNPGVPPQQLFSPKNTHTGTYVLPNVNDLMSNPHPTCNQPYPQPFEMDAYCPAPMSSCETQFTSQPSLYPKFSPYPQTMSPATPHLPDPVYHFHGVSYQEAKVYSTDTSNPPFALSEYSTAYSQQNQGFVPAPEIAESAYYESPVLHDYVAHDDVRQVQNMLQNKLADVNEKNQVGLSPLLLAVERNQRDMVDLLLRSGADVATSNQNRENVFHLSIKSAEMMGLLVNRLSRDQVRELVNAKGGRLGQTPLHLASDAGNIATILILLNNGASITEQENSGGLTSLHMAVKKANLDAIQVLLNFVTGEGQPRDVDNLKKFVCQTTYSGNSALDFACELHQSAAFRPSSSAIQSQIVELLVKSGAEKSSNRLPRNSLSPVNTQLHQLLRSCPGQQADHDRPALRQTSPHGSQGLK
ncbi:unnamed protein product [Clavelina lepadiformis]|uniref:Uncharacterized protein n=1 Tax=Clavelina lepadiformis TaxID=159417 RepID=A0ABP0GN51_CLALP